MITVSILEKEDIVQPNDWCRPLQIVSMSGGHSDFYSFECQYTRKPENNVKWVRADQILGDIWFKNPTSVGKLNSELNIKYEFIRGDVPKSHQYGATVPELNKKYDQQLRTTKMPYGKHKGRSLAEIENIDRDYFVWLISQGIIQSNEDFIKHHGRLKVLRK